jgi:TonB family protein
MGASIRSHLLLVLATGLLLGAAPASDIQRPDWKTKPAGEAISRVYPDAAMRQGEGGKVVLGCTVAVSGLLGDCAVVSEDPPGFGFGKAALSLTAEMTMNPAKVRGRPIESTVRIPLSFTPWTHHGRIGWEDRVDCAGIVLDDAESRALAWPPGEEQAWYGLDVTAGLREQNLSAEALLGGLRAPLARAGKARRPTVRAPELEACRRQLKGPDR